MICLTHKDMVLDRLLDPKEQASNNILNEKISYYYQPIIKQPIIKIIKIVHTLNF